MLWTLDFLTSVRSRRMVTLLLPMHALPEELHTGYDLGGHKIKERSKQSTRLLSVSSLKVTLCAMCGMHIHTLSGGKRTDVEEICPKKNITNC